MTFYSRNRSEKLTRVGVSLSSEFEYLTIVYWLVWVPIKFWRF